MKENPNKHTNNQLPITSSGHPAKNASGYYKDTNSVNCGWKFRNIIQYYTEVLGGQRNCLKLFIWAVGVYCSEQKDNIRTYVN